MRSLWKGALTVGKVSIPVTLHKTGEHDHPVFRSLHRECGTPVEQQRRCPSCEVTLGAGYAETVRGFEVAEGQFVTVENEELEAALGGKVLKLDRFVGALEVSPAQSSTGYWLLPERKSGFAQQAYATLRDAMLETELVGLCRLVYFTKEHVALVWPSEDGLLGLATLYVGAELRDVSELASELAKVEVGEKELQLMTAAIEQRRKAYRPRQLARSYPRRVLELVAEKAKGGTITAAPPPAAATVDLVEALTASIRKPGRRRVRSKALA